MKKLIRLFLTLLGIFLVLCTIIFTKIFISRCLLPYTSEGSYFDPEAGIVWHEQAVVVYGMLALITLALTILDYFLLKRLKVK